MADSYICFNNKFYESTKPIFEMNRAMSYGDGLFETIRIKNGEALFQDLHFKRLKSGLEVLKIELNSKQWQEIKTCIIQLVIKNEIEEGGRLKLMVFRKGEGKYTPITNDSDFYISAEKIEDNIFMLNKKGLNMGIATSIRIRPSFLTSYKTLNKLDYVLASLEAKEKGFDDLAILNNQGNLVESCNSNIFLVKSAKVYTPPIKDGCLTGILRHQIIQLAKKINVQIVEKSLKPEDLERADEIFLTNSIRGIQWIGSYNRKRYFNKVSQLFVNQLNRL